MRNIKMFCWIKIVWDPWWIGFKVKIIKLEPMKNKISLSCIDDKIHIQNNGCDGLALS